jgi:hypothetical protein
VHATTSHSHYLVLSEYRRGLITVSEIVEDSSSLLTVAILQYDLDTFGRRCHGKMAINRLNRHIMCIAQEWRGGSQVLLPCLFPCSVPMAVLAFAGVGSLPAPRILSCHQDPPPLRRRNVELSTLVSESCRTNPLRYSNRDRAARLSLGLQQGF